MQCIGRMLIVYGQVSSKPVGEKGGTYFRQKILRLVGYSYLAWRDEPTRSAMRPSPGCVTGKGISLGQGVGPTADAVCNDSGVLSLLLPSSILPEATTSP